MVYDRFNQTAVQPHIGVTFASSLRTILRQDPDIIMVGEIRDLIGVPSFLINSTLIGVVAQRLVRKVCHYCVEQYNLSEDECYVLGINYDKFKNIKVSIGRGCPQCRGTGYLGRTGIFEVMEITERIRSAIDNKATPSDIKKIAKGEGLITLRECAVKKMLKGITTFDEVIRVTGLLG